MTCMYSTFSLEINQFYITLSAGLTKEMFLQFFQHAPKQLAEFSDESRSPGDAVLIQRDMKRYVCASLGKGKGKGKAKDEQHAEEEEELEQHSVFQVVGRILAKAVIEGVKEYTTYYFETIQAT